MNFASDNIAPIAPKIFESLSQANDVLDYGYGNDSWSLRAQAMIKERFHAADARVFFVPTGTAANALALGAMTKPWDVVFCHEEAHIYCDEAGAPEFYTHGNKLIALETQNAKILPHALAHALEETGALGVHNMQRGALSLTNLTELGSSYTQRESQALIALAKSYNCPIHLDGARFANAVIAQNCEPKALANDLDVDILVLGGTKNGAMGAEAVVIFNEDFAHSFEMLRKRGGHLLSKGAYLGAQFCALMDNDYWLELARAANEKMRAIYDELSAKNIEFLCPAEGNMGFFKAPRHVHNALMAQGAKYYLVPATQSPEGDDDELLIGRIVTHWATKDEEIRAFLQVFS